MGQLTLPESGTIYLDTSPVIYSVEKIVPYVDLMAPVWQSAKSGAIQLVSSQLLLLETLIKPVRDSDSKLESIYRQLLTESKEFQLQPIDLSVLEQAIQLRSEVGLKTPDAIHVATAILAKCDLFVTNDLAFKRVFQLEVSVLNEFIEDSNNLSS